VRDHRLENRMESFFLAETTKYLYLMFDRNNFIHNTGGSGSIVNTPSGQCIIDAGKWRHLFMPLYCTGQGIYNFWKYWKSTGIWNPFWKSGI